MEPLSEDEFVMRGKKVFDKVFASPDPFGGPFRPALEPRLLLCPFNYTVHGAWVAPFLKGLRKLGQAGFYVSLLDRPHGSEQRAPYHWHVPLEHFDAYSRKLGAYENATYSEVGNWGLIASHEDFALIAGPEELINEFKLSIPDLDQRIHDFLDLWASYHVENQADVKWIGTMLAHVFGRDQANGYIEGSEIRSLLGTG